MLHTNRIHHRNVDDIYRLADVSISVLAYAACSLGTPCVLHCHTDIPNNLLIDCVSQEYAETYDINVQVKETTSRGYYLSVSADLGLDLPQIFIQPVKNGRFIHCTTEEVSQDLLVLYHYTSLPRFVGIIV